MASFRDRQRSTSTGRSPVLRLWLGPNFIPYQKYVRGFSYEYGVEQMFTATFNLFDPNYDEIETYLHNEGVGISVRFQFGWQGLTGGLDDLSPEYVGFVKMFESSILPMGGSELTITIQFPMASILYLKPSQLITADDINRATRISDLVVAIANRQGLKHEVEPTIPFSDSDRDTNGHVRPEHPAISSLTTCVSLSSYLRELVGFAVSTSERPTGAYTYYVREDGTLFFGTPGYQQERVYDSYVYGAVTDGRVSRFALTTVKPILLGIAGGLRPQVLSCDDDGRVAERGLEDEPGEQADGRNRGDDEQAFTRVAGEDAFQIPGPIQLDQTTAARYARQRYYLYSRYSYIAEAEVLGDPKIPLRSWVRWTILRQDSRPHYASGYYLVLAIRHEIGEGRYTTWMKLARNAVNAGDIVAAGPFTPDMVGEENLHAMLEMPDGFLVHGRLRTNAFQEHEHVVAEAGTYELPGYVRDFNSGRIANRIGTIVAPDSGGNPFDNFQKRWRTAREEKATPQ